MAPTLQTVIDFPVRKTRSSSRRSQLEKSKNGESQLKDLHDSSTLVKNRKRTQEGPSASCSPPKLLKNSLKSTLNSFGQNSSDVENLRSSPSKQLFVSPKKSPLKDENIETKTFKSPLKPSNHLNSSPIKKEFLSTQQNLEKLKLTSPQRTIKQRILNENVHLYQKLKRSFASSHCSHFVGRENEIDSLQEFLSSHLVKGVPGSLYVSGAPGTGKTASITRISQALKVPKMKTIFLNCMSQKSSNDIFAHIAINLGINSSKKEILSSIEHHFSTSKYPILLILDEVDQLESKNQDVLYTIFEWPSLANSKLVLVGIANMLDLTDRVLPRLQANSSCRPELLHFPPYSKMEIVSIINDRIKEADIGVEIFKPASIHFLAGKISAVAGDVRKALDVCRRAVELCEIKAKNETQIKAAGSKSPGKKCSTTPHHKIDIPLLLIIFNEIFGSRVTPSAVTSQQNEFPLQHKVLIATLVLILKNAKVQDVTVGQFHEVYSRVCRNQKLASVDQSEFFSVCGLLEMRGLLQIKQNKEPRNSKILSRLDQEEAEKALGDKFLLASILNDVSSLGKLARKKK